MKLGFTTYDNLKALPFAQQAGFDCLEFTTLPGYQGMDLPNELTSPASLDDFKGQIQSSGIEVDSIITAINPMAADPEVASAHKDYFRRWIELAGRLGVSYVSSTSGQNPALSLDDNVKLFGEVYRDLCRVADDNGVRIVFENCLHGYPKGSNIAVNPETWSRIFNEVDTPALGLEFDPSHLVYQFIDPVQAAAEFVDKIYILHAKDTEVLAGRLSRGGLYGNESWWRFRMPGYGDVDWPGLFQVLREGGFDGSVIIEHEDPVFHSERLHEGLLIGQKYLQQFVW